MKTYQVPVELRFADLDAYGHVNNATYFTFLETARTKLIQNKFIHFMQQPLQFLVIKAECEYKRPIELDDTVIVSLAITRIGGSSFDIDYELHNGTGAVFATAKTIMVCYDGQKKKPTQVPPEFKDALSATSD